MRLIKVLSVFTAVVLGSSVGFSATNLPGIVAWWPLQGNGSDVSGLSHHLSIQGSPLVGDGEVGQGLVFDGGDDYGRIAAHPDLDLGAYDGMSIEMWIDPANTSPQQPLLEWTDNVSVVGLHFWISVVSPWAGGGPRSLFANVIDRNGLAHHVSSAPNAIGSNVFTHVAFTYSKLSGLARLYANGQLVAQTNLGFVVPETRTPLYVGLRPLGGGVFRYAGKLDEITLYSRELSQAELNSIFEAGPAGKSAVTNNPPPVPGIAFDISRDFGMTDNPAGVWSYGAKSNFAGAFELLADVRTFSADNGVPIRAWERTTFNLPVVAKVLGTNMAVSDGGRFTAPGGTVYFAPGADGAPQNFGVIRFTAPSNGNYRIETEVHQLFDSTRSRDSDFHVLKDGVELFGAFLPPNSGTNFTAVVSLGVGAMLEFAVGRGADGLTADSGLKIAALITPTTNPPTGTNDPHGGVSPSGIVAWWPFEGNGADISGGNNPMPLSGGPAFAAGEVGQSVLLNGATTYGRLGANHAIDLGAHESFSAEMWVAAASVADQQPLLEWSDGVSTVGLHFWISVASPWAGGGAGSLYANFISTDQIAHHVSSPPGVLVANHFQHVAMTYSRESGIARLYANGVLVAHTNIGSLRIETRGDLFLARRPFSGDTGAEYAFTGAMDEVTLYARELSAVEVASIFLAGPAGKDNGTNVRPVIIRQPENQIVPLKSHVNFSVEILGQGRQRYQWYRNGRVIPGADGPTLTIPTVKPRDAGVYQVQVKNAFGTTRSQSATLTVQRGRSGFSGFR